MQQIESLRNCCATSVSDDGAAMMAKPATYTSLPWDMVKKRGLCDEGLRR